MNKNKTNKDILKELEKIIHKAVPEIMELKFGCKVKDKSDNQIMEFLLEEEKTVLSKTRNYFSVKGKTFVTLILASSFEILGRDITLEDVLVALGEAKYCIDAMGQMWIDYSDDDRKAQWVFNKSLENQSEDLIKFLHEILCK